MRTTLMIALGALFFIGQHVAWGDSAALSLEEALTEGLNRSPEVQRAQAAREEAGWRRFEMLGRGFLPKVSISGEQFLAKQYEDTSMYFAGQNLVFPGFYPTSQASLDVSVPVFDGLANWRHMQAASLSQQASEKELSFTEFQLSEQIRLAFYQALAADQLNAVAEQNVKTLEDHLRQVQVQMRGGVATNYDTLRVEVQLSEARADAVDAKDNLILARKKLTELLGLDSDERPLVGILPVPDIAHVKDLEYTEVPKDRADIEALNLRSEAAAKARMAANAWLVPTISLGGQYMYYDSQFFSMATNSVQDTGAYKDAYSVGIFLKWNLFDGGVALAQAREASYQAVEAEKAEQAAKLKIPYDFAYWKRRYIANSDHYQSKKFDIVRSEESVRLAKEEERAGTRTSTETLDAELDLFRARAGVVNAQVNAAEAQIQLELALGRRI